MSEMPQKPWEHGGVAIVGGGIAGLTLLISLLQRNIPCTIYEQAASFTEIGAGVAFTPNAVRAMLKCDRGIFDAFKKVATHNTWESKRAKHEMVGNKDGTFTQIVKEQGTYFEFLDGYNQGNDADDESGEDAANAIKMANGSKVLFTLYNDEGANSVHRAHFLDELIKLIPDSVARFNKRLEHISGDELSSSGPLILHFSDGTTAIADAIVGTDGIKSRVRSHILDTSHTNGTGSNSNDPSSARSSSCSSPSRCSSSSNNHHATYTQKYAYRGLIPMDTAISVLGEDLSMNAKMHLGPNSHVLTFPIKGGETMNVVAFHTTSSPTEPWPSTTKLTLPTTKSAALHDFHGWGTNVTKILNLLEDNLDRWAIFDMLDNPAPTYTKGRIVISGDAAHATSPHHGSGAGFAIEDSAVLAELLLYLHNLYSLSSSSNTPNFSEDKQLPRFSAALSTAFQAFDQIRRPRTQWLVESSRRTGDLFEWRAEGVGEDIEKMQQELEERHRIIWDGDIEQYCAEGVGLLKELAV